MATPCDSDAPVVADALRDWIVRLKPDAPNVELDTPLIDAGVLDSLEMVNFLLYIESLRSEEIPEALIQPEYFRSLRTIANTFFTS